jgi:hypothetical protein
VGGCCRDACIIVLESGYSIGFLFAVGLHLLLPMEAPSMGTTDMKTGDLQAGLYDPTAPKCVLSDPRAFSHFIVVYTLEMVIYILSDREPASPFPKKSS